ncbi:MAG: DUF1223 domain-containing protein [Burkholderiales bacterium]
MITPVIELYTSEGCSSCPPADRWLSTLKSQAQQGHVVVQAFHVGYWDYIGWADRFAKPAFTARQRTIAAAQGRSSVYTPQLLRNGNDWRDWGGSPSATATATASARASITLQHVTGDAGGDQFTAKVEPLAGHDLRWSAYWSVTEHGHASKVAAGENAGNALAHDFVVRQYVPMGTYQGKATLSLRPIAVDPLHPRQINLVVLDPVNGEVMQANSLACAAAG